MDGRVIESGNEPLLFVPFKLKEGYAAGDGEQFILEDVSLSDNLGRLIPIELVNVSTTLDSQKPIKEFSLRHNFPNPFNPNTTISYTIKEPGKDELYIFNIIGQEVKRLVDHNQDSGSYTIIWDGTDYAGEKVSGGLYLYRLKLNDFVNTKKMMFIKYL